MEITESRVNLELLGPNFWILRCDGWANRIKPIGSNKTKKMKKIKKKRAGTAIQERHRSEKWPEALVRETTTILSLSLQTMLKGSLEDDEQAKL